MNPLSLAGHREQRRREDTRYHKSAIAKLIDDLGDDGLFGRLDSLVKELRSDGFSDAAFHAIQALPLLKQAEMHLERAKGRVK